MIRKSTNDLSIRPKMSRTVAMTIVVGGLLALCVGLYLAHDFGVRSGHAKYQEDQILIKQLNESISSLRSELSTAEEGLIFSQRQQQIQEEAYKQISQAYANSEQKNSVLGSRLDFYRSIISPEDGQAGPAVQALESSYAEGVLSFDVTLVQAIKHKHQVRGNLKVTLFEGDAATGQWPASSSRSVNFQYFQQISGTIESEQMVENAKLKVELDLQSGEKIERWFNLAEISTRQAS